MSRLIELAETLHYIATSLQHLDAVMTLPSCPECDKYGACEYEPEWGHPLRYNCPLWEPREKKED